MSPTSAVVKPAALGLAAFVALTIGVATDVLTGLDQSIATFLARTRPSMLYWPARAGFSLGQNWVFPLASAIVAVLLAVRSRHVRPLVGLLGVWLVHTLVIGAVKLWAGRPPPGTGDPHLHAVAADLHLRMSYPSGHAANIVVFSAVLGILLAALTGDPRWIRRSNYAGAIAAAVCVVCMIFLGFHWTTDAAAGLALGTVLRVLLTPPFARFACKNG